MTTNDLKYVVGEAKTGDIATIRFSGKVTEESTVQFNREFEFLESVICPRLIRVLINSEVCSTACQPIRLFKILPLRQNVSLRGWRRVWHPSSGRQEPGH